MHNDASPASTLAILTAARELLSDPAKWTKGAYALDGVGNSVWYLSLSAVCFCSVGAIAKISGGGNAWEAEKALSLTLELDGIDADEADVPGWQDAPERTHAEVLSLFDRTIARLESEVAHA